MSSEVLQAALAYAARGQPVFPCRPDKRPHVRGGFKAASTDPEQIRAWWEQWPDAMIGLPTGSVSGLAVIDVDNKSVNGFPAFRKLKLDLSDVPQVTTPSGGAHFYFRTAGKVVKSTVAVLGPGVDSRGNGGYAIVPPSRPDPGRPGYAWANGHDLSAAPVLPDDIIARLSRDKWTAELDAACDAVRHADEGGRNDTLNREAFRVGKLVAASKLERGHARQQLVNAGVAAGLKVLECERTVDSAFGARGSTRAGAKEAPPKVVLPEPEPADDEVDGAETLDAIAATIRRYVVLSPEQADACALWVLHVHAIDSAEHSPRLHLFSPVKRCGKTTALRVIATMLPRPLPTPNISEAGFFRAIDKLKPALLIDEADNLLTADEGRQLRSLINDGHSRSGGGVIRMTGENRDEIEIFPVFAPVAIAGIGKLPGTLQDRCVSISMQRKFKSDRSVIRFHSKRHEDLDQCARWAARWAADHADELTGADPALPDSLNDREADNWRPLVAIADLAGDDWPQRARKAAAALTGDEDDETDSYPIALLTDCRALRNSDQSLFAEPVVKTTDLLSALHAMDERPWGAFGKTGKPLTAHRLARYLRPFGVKSVWHEFVSRSQGAREAARVYAWSDFRDAWDRYLPPSPP